MADARWTTGKVGRLMLFFFSSRRRHTRCLSDWSSTCALPISRPQIVSHGLQIRDHLVSTSGIKSLREQWAGQHKVVTNLQAMADDLRTSLHISDTETAGTWAGQTLEPETLRKLEALRIEAQTDFTTINSLYQSLTNLSRPQLKRAVGTSSP